MGVDANRGSASRRGAWFAAALFAIVLVAAVIRFGSIGQQPLWHDEIYTYCFVRGFDPYLFEGADLERVEPPTPAGAVRARLDEDRYWSNLSRNLVHEGHPPLYYLLIRAWSSVFGDGANSLRAFSATASALVVFVGAMCVRAVGDRGAALWGAALLALAPFQLHYGVEARSYALTMLLCGLTLWAVLVAMRSKRDSWPLALGAVAAAFLSAATHYYAGLFALAVAVVFAWQVPRRFVLRALPGACTAGVLAVSWLPVLAQQTAAHEGTHWTEGATSLTAVPGAVVATARDLLTGPRGSATIWEVALVVAAIAVVAPLGLRRMGRFARRVVVSLVVVCVLFEGLVLAVDLLTDHHTILVPRYAAALHVPLVVVIALLARKAGPIGLAALLVLLAQHAVGGWLTAAGERAPRQAIDDAAHYVAARAEPDDVVVVVPSGPTFIGFALYTLRSELITAAVPAADADAAIDAFTGDGRGVWLFQQRLGHAYVELPDDETAAEDAAANEQSVSFIGVDVRYAPPE